MPGGDRTGPLGRGPGSGKCVGAVIRPCGKMGRGARMGYRRGFAWSGYCLSADSEEGFREALENRAAFLERELAAVKSKLSENKIR